jgi:hypothetical protein
VGCGLIPLELGFDGALKGFIKIFIHLIDCLIVILFEPLCSSNLANFLGHHQRNTPLISTTLIFLGLLPIGQNH